MKALSASSFLLAILVLAPQAADAVITFTQLDDGIFTVSHRIKLIGSRGRATKMVYTKAASLCIAAGYTHYTVLNQESDAGQQYESANATLRVRFYQQGGDERIGCENSADPTYKAEALAKLQKRGYTPPPPLEEPAAADGMEPTGNVGAGTPPGSCTIEQIAAMARAGLTDEKIRAACR